MTDGERFEGDVRLVALTTRPASWLVDAVVDSRTSPLGSIGTPIAIEVERPGAAWFDLALGHMLTQWVGESRLVAVAVAPSGDRFTVQLESSGSTVRSQLVRLVR